MIRKMPLGCITNKKYLGERKLVMTNGKLLDYHDDFRLIFKCQNTKIHVQAEIAAAINIVNFTITHAGLTGKANFMN